MDTQRWVQTAGLLEEVYGRDRVEQLSADLRAVAEVEKPLGAAVTLARPLPTSGRRRACGRRAACRAARSPPRPGASRRSHSFTAQVPARVAV